MTFLVCWCLQREDLGPCGKIHSEAMRGDFEKASQKTDYNVEEEVSTEGRGGEGHTPTHTHTVMKFVVDPLCVCVGAGVSAGLYQ